MRICWRTLLVVVTGSIFYLSLVPAPPSDGLGWDKANHAVAMGFIAFLAYLAFRPALRAVVFGALYALLLGLLIEVLQGLCTHNRMAEWGDLAADVLGVVVVAVVLSLWKRRKGRC